MKPKPVTPYQRLLAKARTFASAVAYPRTRRMFLYPKAGLATGYTLTDLYQRVLAAQDLGYDVHLTADDAGLHTAYVAKRPEAPLR